MEMPSSTAQRQPQDTVVKNPNQSYEFLTGKDGHYLRKRTRLFEACVKTPNNPEMPEIGESAKWLAPKMPYAVIADCVAFFRAVWAEHGSEAIALLFLEDSKWSAEAPQQAVGPASLSYGSLPAGRRPVGSIHSHGAMKAFHSGTDMRDAEEFDGVHLVVGRLDLPSPEFVAALHINGRQFQLDIKEIVDGLPEPMSAGLWHPWLDMVKKSHPPAIERFKHLDEEDEELWDRLMEY